LSISPEGLVVMFEAARDSMMALAAASFIRRATCRATRFR
jgi:hypothetical protein